jgi:hypothetical protein
MMSKGISLPMPQQLTCWGFFYESAQIAHQRSGATGRGKYRQAAGALTQDIKVMLVLAKKRPRHLSRAEFTSNASNA